MINEIRNKVSLFSILTRQLGSIVGIEVGLIICYFFVDFEIIMVIQIRVIPIILIILFSKYTNPLINIKIDYSNQNLQFNNAILGKHCRLTKITFDQIFVQKRWKWLLNFYQEVIEIKEGSAIKIVVPIIDNKQFIDALIQELQKMKAMNFIKKKQISDNLMH